MFSGSLVKVFVNRGSTEPQGSTSDRQGFRRNSPKVPGTKFANTVLCSCSNTTVS